MRTSAGTSNEMFLMPIHESGYGSNGSRAPGPSSNNVIDRAITHPVGKDLVIQLVDETGVVLTTTRVTGGASPTGGASRGRWMFPENAYFGTTASLAPASSNVTGVDIYGTTGRVVASAPAGPSAQFQRQDAAGAVVEFYASTAKVGSITISSSATTYSTNSDKTLKDDDGEMPLETAIQITQLIEWHSYKWKSTGTSDYGVFAQELYEIYPQAVVVGGVHEIIDGEGNTLESYDPWGVDYSKLIVPFGRALQGLLAKAQDLESRLARIEQGLQTSSTGKAI